MDFFNFRKRIISGIIFIALTFLVSVNAIAQKTITIRPDVYNSGNAMIVSNLPNKGYPDHPDFASIGWTNGSDEVIARSFMRIDLSAVPYDAFITSAKLSLYSYDSNSNGAHSTKDGSNESYLRRVVETWDKRSITWNNQPATTEENQILLAGSTLSIQNYLNIDVTAMINDMLSDGLGNNGFMIQLKKEEYYRRMVFASGSNASLNLRPKLEITYSHNPIAYAGNDTVICSGQPIDLFGLGYTKTFDPVTYHWSSPQVDLEDNEWEELSYMPEILDVPQYFEFILKVQSESNGLYSMPDTVRVTVLPTMETPKVSIEDKLYLTSTEYKHYRWFYNESEVDDMDSQIIKPLVDGIYTVVGVDEYGCTSELSNKVYVSKPKSVAKVVDSVCLGDTITLDGSMSSVSYSLQNYSYKWSCPYIVLPNDSSKVTSFIISKNSNPGRIPFVLVVSNDQFDSEPDTAWLTINAIPELPIIQQNGDTLVANLATDYQWYLEGKEIKDATKQEYLIAKSGKYQVKTINETGCYSEISDLFTAIKTSVEKLENGLSVYPNPTTESVVVSGLPINEKTTISVYDALGKLHQQFESNGESTMLNLSNLTRGTYMLNVKNKKVQNIKVTKK